jgi:hypothetical protein
MGFILYIAVKDNTGGIGMTQQLLQSLQGGGLVVYYQLKWEL